MGKQMILTDRGINGCFTMKGNENAHNNKILFYVRFCKIFKYKKHVDGQKVWQF